MNSKIQIHHRQKMAYVYLRQSTMAQVYHHQESTNRQYALKDRALELGWPPTAIAVIDEDQGRSGSSATARTGFQRLVDSGQPGSGGDGADVGSLPPGSQFERLASVD